MWIFRKGANVKVRVPRKVANKNVGWKRGSKLIVVFLKKKRK